MVVFITLVFLINSVFGANSPAEIWDFNSKAKEILVGTVLNVELALNNWNLEVYEGVENRYFELEINQVRKTSSNLKEGGIIKVPFYRYLVPVSGGAEVIVEKGDLIKIYANPTTMDENVFELAIGGDSVIHLISLNDPNIEEVSKDCFVYRGTLLIHFKEGTTEKHMTNVLWKQHPGATSLLYPDKPFDYIVYLATNSSYSDVKEYVDAYQKEDSVEYVKLKNHNESCYPDYSEKIPEKLTLNIFQKIWKWILDLFR